MGGSIDSRISLSTTTSVPMPSSLLARQLSPVSIAVIAILGFLILSSVLTLAALLYRERRRHLRLIANLEERGINIQCDLPRQPNFPTQTAKIGRSRNVLRRNSSRAWDALPSTENLTTRGRSLRIPTHRFTRPAREPKDSLRRISWPFSRAGSAQSEIPMRPICEEGRSSAVVESLTMSCANVMDCSQPIPNGLQALPPEAQLSDPATAQNFRRMDSVSDLRPGPLAVTKKRHRSKTMDIIMAPPAPMSDLRVTKRPRSTVHVRSFSLGNHIPTSAPEKPAPPLPLAVKNAKSTERPRSSAGGRLSSPRFSASSIDSIGSSLLAASPKLQRSASEKSARWQNGACREYPTSLIAGPRPLRSRNERKYQPSPEHDQTLRSLKGSIRSIPDSVQSDDVKNVRPTSLLVMSKNMDTLLLPRVGTADAVRISRVSLASSGIQSSTNDLTPRRQSRLIITPNGSPAHRVTSIALKEVSGNPRLSRPLSQTSVTSASSTRSSNGNPFQFDPSTMASGKPSAMKGSPSSRGKGHKRKNCVRISLSPTVITSRRRSSPSPLMADIEEEASETLVRGGHQPILSSMGRLPHPPAPGSPRPPSTSTFKPQISMRPNSFRASLTSSSPVLSSMQFTQDSIPQHISVKSSPHEKNGKRKSVSLVLSIPTFPSPAKVSLIEHVLPTPTFSYTRASDDIEHETPVPEGLALLAQPFSPVRETNSVKPDSESEMQNFVFPTMKNGAVTTSQVSLGSSEAQSAPPETSSSSGQRGMQPKVDDPTSQQSSLRPSKPSATPIAGIEIRPPTAIPSSLNLIGTTKDALPLYSPSPISGGGRRSSLLLSPTAQTAGPESALRLSIAQLRRMNSDANNDAKNPQLRSARRYQRMGKREESPLPEQDFHAEDGTPSRDSLGSDWDIDGILENGLRQGNEHVMKATGWEIVDVDSSGQDITDCKSEGEQQRADKHKASVWELDEDAWKLDFRECSRDMSPLLNSTSAYNCDNMGVQSPLAHRRISEMRGALLFEKLPLALKGIGGHSSTPKVVVQPPSSDVGTPGSLYDENGFLRERS